MRIRIVGPARQVTEAVAVLRAAFDVHTESRPYPRRTGSDVAVYVDADQAPMSRPSEGSPA